MLTIYITYSIIRGKKSISIKRGQDSRLDNIFITIIWTIFASGGGNSSRKSWENIRGIPRMLFEDFLERMLTIYITYSIIRGEEIS